MKTIFISSFHPHISRNILLTRAFAVLRNALGLKIVLIVPEYKVAYFREQFGAKNVLVEGVAAFQSSRTKRGIFFKRLGMLMMHTETVRLRRGYKYYTERRLWYDFFWRFMALVGYLPLARRMVRAIDAAVSPHDFFDPLFAAYQPNAVFSCDIQNDNDVALMQAARAHGAKVLGMMRSWDNPTQRTIRIFPDHLFVGSAELKDETVAICGFPREKITVSGQPHYDRYAEARNGAMPQTREEFFRAFGLDPKRRLIVYAPIGDLTIRKSNDVDQHIIELLGTVDAQVLVRFPPDESVHFSEDFEKPANVFFHRPGRVFKEHQFTDREIRREDDDSLIGEMAYADVVVTGPTSIGLDAAYFDTPIILANIYPTPNRPFFEKVYQYYCTHIRKLVATGGVHFAETKEDLYETINAYFKNSQRDATGRARIREKWFSYSQDGHAGERLGEAIKKLLL
ncbi:MAG: CDP-glycerol glycerophosphotransferase family protein [bacterium]|nr:CDP-glycerol glycerophosphotransferase family protein [bacterium]MDZ4300018.1 CDP-glycerol glycerophosphotransferase family protein [Candidatus Sungbacteria bacterium]